MNDPIIYRVSTELQTLPATGFDSMVADAPPGLFTSSGRLRLRTLGTLLRELSILGASQVGERLHHGEWVMTADPVLLQQRSNLHDCPSCRAGTDQALAYMREHPDTPMLVGLLYWAGPEPDDDRRTP